MGENQQTINCPKCNMPILNVAPLGNGGYYNGMICPFCSHRFDGNKAVATNLDEGLLIGWRGNNIRYRNGQPEIWSPVCPIKWKPGETMVATCHGVPLADDPHQQQGDKSPAEDCSCGFYAARTQDHILSLGYGQNADPLKPDHVVTEVVQFGRVLVHTLGWKAEKCKMHRIHVPHAAWQVANQLDAIWKPHGVEVVLTDNDNMPKGAVPEWCQHCGARMNPRKLECPLCDKYNNPTTAGR